MIRTFEERANLRIRLLTYKYPIDHPCSIINDDINRALNDLSAIIRAELGRMNQGILGKIERFQGLILARRNFN